MDMKKVHLILGHNSETVKHYAQSLKLELSLNFIYNSVYLKTGNTLSLIIGLRQCSEDTLIMDGDVLYPPKALFKYVENSKGSSFALVSADINDVECSKVLLNPSGNIHAFITKRALTNEERSGFQFGGEAIGFFKLLKEDASRFINLYEKKEQDFRLVLWEIPLTEFAMVTTLHPWQIKEEGAFEIDTQEDYSLALNSFLSNPGLYKI